MRKEEHATRADAKRQANNWIFRTRMLLQHLMARMPSSDDIDSSSMHHQVMHMNPKVRSLSSSSDGGVDANVSEELRDLFQKFQSELDFTMTEFFDPPVVSVASLDYCADQRRNQDRGSLVPNVHFSNWMNGSHSGHHWFDQMNFYLPLHDCVRIETRGKSGDDDNEASFVSLHTNKILNRIEKVLLMNSQPFEHMIDKSAFDRDCKRIFGDELSMTILSKYEALKTMKSKHMFLFSLCQSLLSQNRVSACINVMKYMSGDERLIVLASCFCLMKVMLLDECLELVSEKSHLIPVSILLLIQCYCYTLMNQWNHVNDIMKQVNDIVHAKNDSRDVSISALDRYYFSYFMALSFAKQDKWSECVESCEDSLESVLEVSSDKNDIMIRIQPLLLYAYSLGKCYRYEQAEITFIEITKNLFPSNAQGHLHYALFLKRFEKRSEEYMKQVQAAIQCKDVFFNEWNEKICSSLSTFGSSSTTLKALKNIQQIADSCIRSYGFSFDGNNQSLITTRFSARNKQQHQQGSSSTIPQHIIHCAFLYLLCARVYGKHLQMVENASKLYERASNIERYCLKLLAQDDDSSQEETRVSHCIDPLSVHFFYTQLMGTMISSLWITREMCQYFVYSEQEHRIPKL